jgi:hypothetical protein
LRKEDWFVDDEREDCSFTVRTEYDTICSITGGITIGEQIDYASRIAKLPQLERELAEAKKQRDRLAVAARAVVDRWETPLWKDAPHTGQFIRALADALDALNAKSADTDR